MAKCSNDTLPYVPLPSLWNLIEQNVNLNEQDEIKGMLGASLVETNIELHNEVNALLDIFENFRRDCCLENGCSTVICLPEPPHVRERLIHEIVFLVENIHEKYVQDDLSSKCSIPVCKSDVLEYAKKCVNSSLLSQSSKQLSLSSGKGQRSSVAENNQTIRKSDLSPIITGSITDTIKKLDYMHFDEVCENLRYTLLKEIRQMEMDVSFLQDCLYAEAAHYDTKPKQTLPLGYPSLSELRKERALLEEMLLNQDCLRNSSLARKPTLHPIISRCANINKQHHLEPVTMTVHPTMRGGSCTGSHSCSSQQLTNSASISGSRTVTDSASVVQLQLEKNSSTHTGEILCTVRNALASKLSCLPVDADIADNVCTPTCEQTCFSIFPLSSHHRSSAISHTKVVAIGNVDHSVSCIPETFTHEPHPPSTKKPQRLWTCSADKFHRIFKNHGESAT